MVAKFWERLAVNKQAEEKFYVEGFKLRKQYKLEVERVSDSNLKQICSFGELK
jgi:hypothetical protein